MSKKSLQESFSLMASKSIARYGYFSLDTIVQCRIKHRNNKVQINLATRKKLVPFSCNKQSKKSDSVLKKRFESDKTIQPEKTVSRFSNYRLACIWNEISSLTEKLSFKK